MEKGLLNPDRALEIILNSVSPVGKEQVALRDALGRVLSDDVRSDLDLPPFDNSAMDGYAVVARDTSGASRNTPKSLEVIAEQPAGRPVTKSVVPGTAIRIMTGAPLPQGADAVVIVEHTEARHSRVIVYVEAAVGANIRRSGEDVRRDELVLRAGDRIGPAEMGMLGALGHASVGVYRRPIVAIITTGDELVDISETPGPGKIRDSNQYSVLGQTLRAGGEVSIQRRSTDEREELARILAEAADSSDLIITTGGVSVGAYDFVKETLARLGEINFWKVAIKPGKPLAYGRINGKPIFGLPGNSVSSMVTFDLFVRPALMRLSGRRATGLTVVKANVSQALKHEKGRREFVRATTKWENDGFVATPTGRQGSGRLSSMLGANSYIVVGESTEGLTAGDTADVILIDGRLTS